MVSLFRSDFVLVFLGFVLIIEGAQLVGNFLSRGLFMELEEVAWDADLGK